MNEPYYPEQGERQIPLGVKYETKPLWVEIELTFGVGATGAAIVVAAFEAFFIGTPVSYSRNKNYYGPHRHQLIKYKAVLQAVDRLAAAGWIKHYRQAQGNFGWQSAFEATPELIDTLQSILAGKPRLKLARLPQTTILRDENGKPIDYKRTRQIDRQDRKTEGFNEAISAADINHGDPSNVVAMPTLACPLARIHNKNFGRGGRYFSMGASWQNIKSEARRALTIDGEPVVELDFDGMHIAMLYAEAGLPLPRDCHDLPGWPRKLVKVATFTLINATNEMAARMSIAHSEHLGELAEPGSQEAIGKARALIEAIKHRHAPIAGQLHSDAGARLMRKDSDIAEAVMAELILRKGIVALPVHDSFLVPASKRDELEEAMTDAAYKIMGVYLSVSEAGTK
ncbi:hypothetical protein [Sulfitobacter sp. PS-8MA]|uniref:hypothetical protein n=1 Tax=Sulfitobacter sp. PS-8MA TaxID=3237707 RepID=UPI0034C670EC